ncbi:hypothetical protein C8N35_11543 [Breoghania corrubedonensis]|uniref:Uncharacterized protein n=1 Tax=Breoghania corrubedonensis TaxID=665038 RepID=A0A2T5UR16_9HYPH|nr:hypothetical protein [Breoghania corrubedonensis]PTW53923.1 hypothetical protein C8N35_11543 [Breoghania corrubedonensis]
MTDRQVIINDYQEVPASDFMAMQDYAQAGVDALVKYAIHDGQAYAGFTVTGSGTFEVTIAPGIYVSAGKMYVTRAAATRDLVEYQPVANKVAVAIVVWGASVDQSPEYRDFVVNLETEETEARQVNLERARIANLGTIGGVESGDPQYPTIPLDRIAIAYVILTPTGIEEIITNTVNDLASSRRNDQRLDVIEDWQALAEPRISTIATDVANLSNAQSGRVTSEDLFQVAGDVARLKEAAGLPDDYADYGADHFLDEDETDTEDLEYLAKVEEGIRFAPANKATSELALFSSINAQVTLTNGLLLPKFTSALRTSVTGYVGEQSITQYTQTSFDVVQKAMSRQRIRFGQIFEVCTNSAWWRSGSYDPVTNIFTRDGETFEVVESFREHTHNHLSYRIAQFWTDSYEEPYWDVVTSTYTLNGAQVAQTFLNSQAGWLTGVDLTFTRRGTSGNVHLTICELTPSGTPDLANAIQQTTIDFLNLRQYPAATTVSFTPTYLTAGKRYAMVLTTQGDHYIGMADGGAYLSGTFFYSTDGAYFAGDITKDMMFGLRFAKFSGSRVAVDLQPLNLDGGIAGIDLLSSMVTPDACDLTFQVQLNTGWVPVSEISTNALAGLPPLLPLQAVFQGTPDLHAGLFLAGSEVSVERPRTTFKHISTPRILAGASDTVRVEWSLGNWNAPHHTFTAVLRAGGVDESPDVVEDTALPDNRLRRVMTFNLDAPVASFQIVASGTTTTALDVFLVEERVDIEF